MYIFLKNPINHDFSQTLKSIKSMLMLNVVIVAYAAHESFIIHRNEVSILHYKNLILLWCSSILHALYMKLRHVMNLTWHKMEYMIPLLWAGNVYKTQQTCILTGICIISVLLSSNLTIMNRASHAAFDRKALLHYTEGFSGWFTPLLNQKHVALWWYGVSVHGLILCWDMRYHNSGTIQNMTSTV